MIDNVFTQIRIKNVPLNKYHDREILAFIRQCLLDNRIKIIQEYPDFLIVKKAHLKLNIPFEYKLYFERKKNYIPNFGV